MLWTFFSQGKRPKGVEAINQWTMSFDNDRWSWIDTFLEIFIQPRFYDTLVSLDLIFSEEERRELRMYFFRHDPFSGGFSSPYKNLTASDKLKLEGTLTYLLLLFGVDSDLVKEVVSTYIETGDYFDILRAVSKNW